MSIGVGRQVDLTDFHRDPSSALLGIGNRVVFSCAYNLAILENV
jgi:hypothetical protein